MKIRYHLPAISGTCQKNKNREDLMSSNRNSNSCTARFNKQFNGLHSHRRLNNNKINIHKKCTPTIGTLYTVIEDNYTSILFKSKYTPCRHDIYRHTISSRKTVSVDGLDAKTQDAYYYYPLLKTAAFFFSLLTCRNLLGTTIAAFIR